MAAQYNRQRYRRATPKWANLAHIKAIYEFAEIFGYHVDHIVPINSPLVCGLHCRDNLQYLLPGSNIKKSNKFWPDMWLEQMQLLPEEPLIIQTRLINYV